MLKLLIDWLKVVVSKDKLIYADLSDLSVLPVCDLFCNVKPDVAICSKNDIYTWELTVRHETNLESSRVHKQNRYANIGNMGSSLAASRRISAYTIEVSTLGFISTVSDFTSAVNVPTLPIDLKQSITRSVINNSFIIYCNRNKSAN